MTSQVIDVQGVTRRFGEITAVDNLSLTIEAGEVFGFLGHNGAGKTTTIRLINGVLTLDSGVIRVMGFDSQTEGTKIRARTGVLTETPSLDERLTAIDNLSIFADLFSVPVDKVKQRVAEVLEIFGLANRAAEKVGGYSKGMKQRLALARAFLHQPDILFLDEPTSALDPIATQEVHQLIRHVSRDQGRTIFLCTHNLVEAQRLCDRVGVMERGHLVAVGTAHQLAAEMGMQHHYALEIAPDQYETARHIIQQIPAITGCESTDSGLSLTVKNRDAVPDILATLVEKHIRIFAVTPQEASLEDIYLALHQQQGQPQ